YLPLIPPLIAAGRYDMLAVVTCILGGNLVLTHDSVVRTWIPRPGLLALFSAMTIAMLAWLFPPILLAPAAAAIGAIFLASNPFMATRGLVVMSAVAGIAAIEVPLLLQMLGVMDPAMTMGTGTLLMRSPMFFDNAAYMYGSATLFVLSVVISGAFYG